MVSVFKTIEKGTIACAYELQDDNCNSLKDCSYQNYSRCSGLLSRHR